MKKILILFVLVFALLLVFFSESINERVDIFLAEKQNDATLREFSNDKIAELDHAKLIVRSNLNEPEKNISPLPNKALIDVQFICQAPLQTTANWVLHEESCEEAALLMAYNYLKGTTLTKTAANDVILNFKNI